MAHTVAIPHPAKAIYINAKGVDWNDPGKTILEASEAGWNVIILAFYLSKQGPWDIVQTWANWAVDKKKTTVEALHAKGAVLLVAMGGATDHPYDLEPVALGKTFATWSKEHLFDGVDFDLEGVAAHFTVPGKTDAETVQWFADITNAAREVLGPDAIITHAPQAPYFGPIGASITWAGPSGGYVGIYAKAPSITYFLVQYYNQGERYVTYDDVFIKSSSDLPHTAVMEIAAEGVPLNKVVVGKYLDKSDGYSGYVDCKTLGEWFRKAQAEIGWDAGVMLWQWGGLESASACYHAAFPPK